MMIKLIFSFTDETVNLKIFLHLFKLKVLIYETICFWFVQKINSIITYIMRENRELHSTEQKKKYYLYYEHFVLSVFRYSVEIVQSNSNVEK